MAAMESAPQNAENRLALVAMVPMGTNIVHTLPRRKKVGYPVWLTPSRKMLIWNSPSSPSSKPGAIVRAYNANDAASTKIASPMVNETARRSRAAHRSLPAGVGRGAACQGRSERRRLGRDLRRLPAFPEIRPGGSSGPPRPPVGRARGNHRLPPQSDLIPRPLRRGRSRR